MQLRISGLAWDFMRPPLILKFTFTTANKQISVEVPNKIFAKLKSLASWLPPTWHEQST
jgi:hypothetical protein